MRFTAKVVEKRRGELTRPVWVMRFSRISDGTGDATAIERRVERAKKAAVKRTMAIVFRENERSLKDARVARLG